MAKVMVSMPDDLLEAVDSEAARLGTTRSALLRQFALESLRRRSGERAARVEEIMAAAKGHGGQVADVLADHRSSR